MTSISQINTTTEEGKLLLAALAVITTTDGYRDKEPDEVLQMILALRKYMYKK
jgi:hypothetical protein